jgi:aminomethyltransferase
MGVVDIKGPGADRLLNRLLVNDIRDLEPGQVRYSTMCNEAGGIIDDITVYKFSEEQFTLVTSSGPRKQTARWIAEHAVGLGAYVTDISAAIALLSIQGPRSRDFLATVVQGVALEALRFFRFTAAQLNETEIVISRTGYTGELGYELYIPAEEAAVVWDFVIQRGRDFGLRPYGVQAMQSLRIEKAYPLYGPDIDENYSPFHLGLQRWIHFEKREFIGREALLAIQAHGLDQRWVGLFLDGDLPANSGDPIYAVADVASFREKVFTGSEAGERVDAEKAGAEVVGRVTSSAKGHTVGRTLALGFVRVSHSWAGCRLMVDIAGRLTPATVTSTPFFDPEGIRLRGKGPRTV